MNQASAGPTILDPTLLDLVPAALAGRTWVWEWAVGEPEAWRTALVVALLATSVAEIGHVGWLVLERIPPARAVASLAANVVANLFRVAASAASVGVVTAFTADDGAMATDDLVALVALTLVPYLLGPIVLMPYYGPSIERLLDLWSFVLLADGLRTVTGIPQWSAVLVVAVAWLVRAAVSLGLGRVVGAIDRPLWGDDDGRPRRRSGDELLDLLRGRASSAGGGW